MKKHSTEWFKAAITKALKSNRAAALTWDLTPTEANSLGRAWQEIGGGLDVGVRPASKLFVHHKHADANIRDAGRVRCAVFGPDHPNPTGSGAYTADELYTAQNKNRIDAERPARQCKAIAAKGGKAKAHYTAHYSDIAFESAFYAYRIKNPAKSAWDATNSLTRQGHPLDRIKPSSAYKRAGRIASKLSITIDDWFNSLA